MDFLFTGWILGNTVFSKKDVIIKISFSILRSMFICMLSCFVNLNLIIYLVIVIILSTNMIYFLSQDSGMEQSEEEVCSCYLCAYEIAQIGLVWTG